MSRHKIFSRSRESFGEPTVNLTPLIDVVFVILIMFIVIAPLLQIEEVELATAPRLSSQPGNVAQESSSIVLHVKGDNRIFFQGHFVPLEELRAKLIEAKRRHPGVLPQLFHDRAASFGTYQSVKNAVEEAGFERIDLILQPS